MANITGTNNPDAIYPGFNAPAVVGDPATIGADTINGLGGNDFIDGGGGSDTIYGGSGNDILVGNTGNDWVEGDSGVDYMVGGTGDDRFDFDLTSVSGVGIGNRDVIYDFTTASGDRIDLSTIFADAADGVFTWRGFNGNFSNASAGEVRYILNGSDRIVQVDLGTDGVNDVDMEIYLVGSQAANLTSAEFWL